jgi:hypothetical protein
MCEFPASDMAPCRNDLYVSTAPDGSWISLPKYFKKSSTTSTRQLLQGDKFTPKRAFVDTADQETSIRVSKRNQFRTDFDLTKRR